MKKVRPIIARSPAALARALDLSPDDLLEMQLRLRLTDKIIQAVQRSGLTHAQVAAAAKSSRTRVTAILNRNISHVSTDLLLRILAALGYRAKISFSRVRHAA